MRDYEQLEVYRRALELSVRVHDFKFAERRVPQLASQVKRAVHSISSNIAEGHDRSPKEFAARLRIAISESREAEHHLVFGVRLNAVTRGDHVWALKELEEVRKMMYGLLRYLAHKQRRS
jgi:four helix bundle protein